MKAYHIYHHKVPFKGGYGVDHTTTVYLVDKNGRFVGPFDVKRSPEDAAAKQSSNATNCRRLLIMRMLLKMLRFPSS